MEARKEASLMLTLSGVSYVYANGTKALDNASLTIPKGMFGLLGPNGAGKSTLMRCIATLQTPSVGSIRFGDIDVIKQPEQLRAVLGYLPQDFGVYPRVSAYDLLDHLAVLKGISSAAQRKDTVETLLNQVNLWSMRKKAVAGFSGGMRQRFGIAQALIGNPQLIIVDEPTAGLDPEERNRFSNLLAEIGENIVVLLSTHIVDDVADLCSQMAIIYEGRIVRTGSPIDLVGSLHGRVWRRTVAKAALADYQGRLEVISTRLRCGQTVIHVAADAPPEAGFEPVEGALEDLYFATLAENRRRAAV
jgi:ABC-2 type transport system ATP-binding protein